MFVLLILVEGIVNPDEDIARFLYWSDDILVLIVRDLACCNLSIAKPFHFLNTAKTSFEQSSVGAKQENGHHAQQHQKHTPEAGTIRGCQANRAWCVTA